MKRRPRSTLTCCRTSGKLPTGPELDPVIAKGCVATAEGTLQEPLRDQIHIQPSYQPRLGRLLPLSEPQFPHTSAVHPAARWPPALLTPSSSFSLQVRTPALPGSSTTGLCLAVRQLTPHSRVSLGQLSLVPRPARCPGFLSGRSSCH